MEIEAIFLNRFSIQKKPQDIFDLIEMAIVVAESKYLHQLEKRRNRIIKTLLNPGRFDWVDEEEEEDDDTTSTLDQQEDDDTSTLDQQEDEDTSTLDQQEDDTVGDEDEEEKQQITNQKPSIKIRLKVMNSLQVAPLEKHNHCNATEEWKKRSETDLIDKQLDADKQGTQRQSHNTTIMGSRKRNVPTQVREIQLSDFSFEKQLDGDKKQSHKGFKKTENLTENKRKEQKECTSGLMKSMPPPLMKMNNVATKRVQVVSDCSPQKQNNCSSIIRPMQKATQSSAVAKMNNVATKCVQVVSDCSPQKQNNCSSIIRPMQKATQSFAVAKMNNVATKRVQVVSDCSPQKQNNRSSIIRPMQKAIQSSAVARPVQKETQSIRDSNMKFESSKRKFEERLAEQREAKRRIIMVDFHHMPKPANDPRAPKRRCWDRRRF